MQKYARLKLTRQDYKVFARLLIPLVVLYMVFIMGLVALTPNREVADTSASGAVVPMNAGNYVYWHGQWLHPNTPLTFHYMRLPIHTAQRQGNLSRQYVRAFPQYWANPNSVSRHLQPNSRHTVDARITKNWLRFEGEAFAFTAHLDMRIGATNHNNRNSEKTFLNDIRIGLTQVHYSWLRTQPANHLGRTVSISVSFQNFTWFPLMFDNGWFFLNFLSMGNPRDIASWVDIPEVQLGTTTIPAAWTQPHHPNFDINLGNTGYSTVPPPAVVTPDYPTDTRSLWDRVLAWFMTVFGITATVATGIILAGGFILLITLVKTK